MRRKARKEHICAGCPNPIEYGTEYEEEETSVYRGRKISQRRRFHLECIAAEVSRLLSDS